MYYYNGITPYDSYGKKESAVIAIINALGYEVVAFRPANKGEYYFDAGDFTCEKWIILPNEHCPRFILLPKPPKISKEYGYYVPWDQIYPSYTLEGIQNLVKNAGYKIVKFGLPNTSDWILHEDSAIITQCEVGDRIRLPRFILKKIEKKLFNPCDYSTSCTVPRKVSALEIYNNTKEVDITGYKVIGFRIPNIGEYFIQHNSSGTILECNCQLEWPHWILEKIDDTSTNE